MKKEPKRWLSSADHCDICKSSFEKHKYFVDGKTIFGPWALMCPSCHSAAGIGLGCGKGQKYDSKTFLLLDGGCKDSE